MKKFAKIVTAGLLAGALVGCAAGKAQAAHRGACQQARSHDLYKFLHDSSPLFIISE